MDRIKEFKKWLRSHYGRVPVRGDIFIIDNYYNFIVSGYRLHGKHAVLFMREVLGQDRLMGRTSLKREKADLVKPDYSVGIDGEKSRHPFKAA